MKAFELAEISEKPVRQLSLGERMRCELVASLLHRPEILFLDEPTIGLDVVAKATIRDLVRERSLRDGCTVLLTSHDTGDMERVCERVLVIHRGRLLLDRPVDALRKSFIPRKRISVVSEEAELRDRAAGSHAAAERAAQDRARGRPARDRRGPRGGGDRRERRACSTCRSRTRRWRRS